MTENVMTEQEVTAELAPVVKVARDLSAIQDLYALVDDQALHQANHWLMPGGAALSELAGDAQPDEWAEQIAAAEFRHYATCKRTNHRDCVVAGAEHVEDQDETETVLQTLLYWSEQWRRTNRLAHVEELDRVTVSSELNIIRELLGWAYEHEPRFLAFAKDINRARIHLEDVLHAGNRTDRARISCIRSGCTRRPRLIRVRAPREEAADRCRACGTVVGLELRDHCPNPWCWSPAPAEPIWTSDPARDYWKCPACKHRYRADEFHDAQAKQLRSEGAQRFVTIQDAVGTLRAQGRSERTIRSWLAPYARVVAYTCPKCNRRYAEHRVRKGRLSACTREECAGAELQPVIDRRPEAIIEGYCELRTRQQYVWWPDLWRLHLTTRRQRITGLA